MKRAGSSLLALLIVSMLANIVVAQDEGSPIVTKLQELCQNIKSIVPAVAILMLILAGTVYAAGQVMGAETRAKANVWATAMLTGSLIGLIIAASAGYLVEIFAQMAIGGTSTLGAPTVTC